MCPSSSNAGLPGWLAAGYERVFNASPRLLQTLCVCVFICVLLEQHRERRYTVAHYQCSIDTHEHALCCVNDWKVAYLNGL